MSCHRIGDAIHILRIEDVNISTFHIGEWRADVHAPFLGAGVVAADRVKATLVLHVDGYVAVRRVDRVDDEVALLFRYRDAILGAGREDALARDGDVGNLSVRRLEDQVLPGANAGGDAREVAGGFEAELIGRVEFAALVQSAIGVQIDGAGLRFRRDGAAALVCIHVGGKGVHIGDSDLAGLLVIVEIPAFRTGKHQEIRSGKVFDFLFTADVDHLTRELLADAAATGNRGLPILLAFGRKRHMSAGHIGRRLQREAGVGDAFLDAAGHHGDQELSRRLRGVHQAIRFFLLAQEFICRQLIGSEFRIAKESAIEGIDVILHFLFGPGVHLPIVHQTVVTHLLVFPVFLDGLFVVPRFYQHGTRVLIQDIGIAVHMGLEGEVLIVLALHRSAETILLLLFGAVFFLQHRLLSPVEQLVGGRLVHLVREIGVQEAAFGFQGHISIGRNDAVDVHIAAGKLSVLLVLLIADVNILIGPRVEAIGVVGTIVEIGLVRLLGVREMGDEGGIAVRFLLPIDAIGRRERDAPSGNGFALLLPDAAVRGNGGDGLGADISQGHRVIYILRHAHCHLAIGADGGEILGAGGNGRVGLAGVAAACEIQVFGVNEALAAFLDNGRRLGVSIGGEVGDAFAILYEAIEADVRIFLRIGDVDETAVGVTGEGNADGIVRLDRRLGHVEVCLLLHQGVVVLLGDPQGPEGAVSLLVESHHLLVHARGIGADFVIVRVGLHRAILPCIGDEGAAIELGGLPLAGVRNLFALLLHFFHRRVAVGDTPPVEFAAVEFVGGGVAGLLAGLVIVPKALAAGGIGIVCSRVVVGSG